MCLIRLPNRLFLASLHLSSPNTQTSEMKSNDIPYGVQRPAVTIFVALDNSPTLTQAHEAVVKEAELASGISEEKNNWCR